VNGYAAYLQDDLAKANAEGTVPGYDFIILEEIDTPKAASVIAPYLFDFDTMTPPDGDLPGDSNLGGALLALRRMNLPDAPSLSPEASNSTALKSMAKMGHSEGIRAQGVEFAHRSALVVAEIGWYGNPRQYSACSKVTAAV
jgi:hypothetical protein